MSQTAIPLQFEQYLQNQISVGKGPDMNEMIFAYIPNLDPSQPIDRNQGLPAVSTWVHQQDIDQVGKLGDNALVYSVVIPGSVAAFTFNAIYLRDKNVPNSCGMVVHKATETKEAGMASTKNLMQQYTGAAQVAGITVDAQTWQIDYQARLLGIEEDMRLANLDNYGHTAFIQGFDVTQQADPAKYKVAPGVVYVGGLRAELKNEVIQTISAKPTGLYIDVVRTGTVLSKWQNIVTVRASATPLTDYVDQNQQQHYVARLAGINANGSITDWRVKTDNADQEWSPFINYSIGHEVVRNSLRYIARLASGPDNGGAVMPGGSDWSIWEPVEINIGWGSKEAVSVIDSDSNPITWIPGALMGVARFISTTIGSHPTTGQVIVTRYQKADDITATNLLLMGTNGNIYKRRYSVSGWTSAWVELVGNDDKLPFLCVPIGAEIAFDTPPPTNDPRFRFVRLTADDDYNGSLLTNKLVSGTAPNLVVKMTVNSELSPINGQQISMLNTIGAIPTPGLTSGVIIQDAIRNLTGRSQLVHAQILGNPSSQVIDGVIASIPSQSSSATSSHSGSGLNLSYFDFNASRQVPTADRVQVFAETRVYYKRIY
ncbi:TPA: phage tail protein [Vibrio cholerae]